MKDINVEDLCHHDDMRLFLPIILPSQTYLISIIQCERVFSHRASLRNHVRSHDSVVDRVLREIADEVEEEMIREQLMEIDTSDNEREDASDNEQEDVSDNEIK